MPTPTTHIPRETAAKLLNISVRTLDRTIRRGFLRTERFDRNVFIPRDAFERYYAKQAHRGGLPPLEEKLEDRRQKSEGGPRGAQGKPSSEVGAGRAMPITAHERDYDLKPVTIYKNLYEELKAKHEEQQRRMEGAHYRVGQLEAQLKNMVPLLEVKQERKRFEVMDRQYKATLQEAKVRVVQTRRVVETERYNKGIYIALVYILLALQPLFWMALQR